MPVKEPLAIIGMGCRFPGGANSPQQFWDMLIAGADATREIPPDRWSVAAYYDPAPGRCGKSVTKRGGFIEGIDLFDPAFFGISAREADCIDPQQRLLLEASLEALEDAGQILEKLRGSRTGVFVGISTTDYATMQNPGGEWANLDIYSPTGVGGSIAANRISYCFDLAGPSLAIDTACSSALNACHVACQSLWAGECRMAIVGGVNALLSHANFVAFSRMAMLSPEGRCKAFDASADGFARAEGVGAIVLKPLSAAQAAGDKIYAVIRSTAANQDGRTNGITVPSLNAQAALVREACAAADISPAEIDYIEAHGTGTPVGDPIEANALGMALGEGRAKPCLIGSVKTNIGHTEAAAGIASLIKAALVLKHREIPPSLHFKKPNPNIDFAKLKLRVVNRRRKFPADSGRLLAGVNSFGFGGANAHAILESAPDSMGGRSSCDVPARAERAKENLPPGNGAPHGCAAERGADAAARRPYQDIRKDFAGRPLVLTISAQGPEALKAVAKNYRKLLTKKTTDAGAVCAAAAARRSHFSNRLCVIGDSRGDLASRLADFAAGRTAPAIIAGEAAAGAGPVFVFSGQGPQWRGMGRELLKTNTLFRKKIEECDELFREFGGWSLLEELSRSERSSRLQQTAIAQPAIFALQVALSELWQSWGVRPAAVVGHSVGEAAAAHVAGVLELREAARVIFIRGHCMDAASDAGRMLAAGLDENAAKEMAAKFNGQAAVAAINSPQSVTFSGEGDVLKTIARTLDHQGTFNRFLHVNYAFHSHHMDGVQKPLLRALGEVAASPPTLKIFSTVTGRAAGNGDFRADYWWHNVRQPVQFAQAISALVAEGHRYFLELSPHPVLAVSISETLARRSAPGKVFVSLRRKEPEVFSMLSNLAAMHTAGAAVDWSRFYPQANAETALPSYPWQREKYWRETAAMHAARMARPAHPLLMAQLRTAKPTWNTWLDLEMFPYLKEHRVQDHIVFPGAAYIEAALGAGHALHSRRAIEVEDMEFQKVLFLSDNKEPMQLQTEYTPADGRLKFLSRASDTEGEWTLNAAAKLRPLAASRPAPVNLQAVRKRMAVELTSAQIYAACEHSGYLFGPSFQGVDALWRRDGEALGRVRLPKQLRRGAKNYVFHPAQLDSCFQTSLFAVPRSVISTGTLLPAHIDRITVFAPATREMYCHSQVIAAGTHATASNFQVTDASGNVLMEIQGFRAQAVRGMSSSRANNPDNWLYENTWIPKPLGTGKRLARGTWVLCADHSGVALELAGLLKKRGVRPVLVFAGDKLQRLGADSFELCAASPDWPRLLSQINATNGHSLAGIVHLWALDGAEPASLDSAALRRAEIAGCHSLMQLAQVLAPEHAALKLWMVTRRAQPVQAGENVSVAQSPVIGLGRTVINEFAKWPSRLVDLGGTNPKENAAHLLRELAGSDGETEVAWRKNERFAGRLSNTTLERHPPANPVSEQSGYQLCLPASGVLDALALVEVPRREPGRNEIEIEISAASLNFRDVMKSLGIYPVNSDLDLLLGDECSGRVVRVGKGVKEFHTGDEVIANSAGCFASHTTVPAAFAVHKPPGLTAPEAATIPVAFMTAWYALHHLGRIQRGEKILIHAATGGVGLAAIQIAKLAGAEIFATAGTGKKRAYLRRLGIRHVMDSRSTAFAGEIRKLTGGAGVNLVLNSLSGDGIAKGLSTLAPGGRFLEIGKRDIYADSAIGLRPFRNNLSLFAIDMGQVLAEQQETARNLLQTVIQLIRTGKLKALPHQTMPVTEAAEAFRLMAQTKHIGKIVLKMDGVPVVPKRIPPREKIEFPTRASYLITGGLGGFGLAVGRWLADRGARHLILAGRRGTVLPEAREAMAALRASGAKVLAVKADIVNERDVKRLFKLAKEKFPPLRGVFHAAAGLDDGLLLQLTPERFSRVMAPKVTGTWNLHRATRGMRLDHFVMFSSLSALCGAAGQANYAAANSFLDGMAHYRRAIGLPALSVNWGALADVGMLARNKRAAENMTAHGVYGLPPIQATDMLGRLMQSDAEQIAFMHVDWRKLFASAPFRSPRYSEIHQAMDPGNSGADGDIRELLSSTPPENRMSLVVSRVTESAAKVLRMNPAKLDPARPLKELGVDSLMAFELMNRLEMQFGISLPPGKFGANTSVNHLAAVILEICNQSLASSKGDADEKPKPAPEHAPAAPVADVFAEQLLTLRSGTSGTPVFFVHPAGGLTNIYDELARKLPDEFPVYAIQSRVVAGASEEWQALEPLVNQYADIVTQRQPEGPVRLAGFSVGGLFAVAIARELERRGRIVSFAGMLDSPLAVLEPDYPRDVVLKTLIAELYDYSTQLGLFKANGKNGLEASMGQLAKKLIAARDEPGQMKELSAWLARRGFDLAKEADSSVKSYFQLYMRHLNMVRSLKLEPVNAPVHLWRARDSQLSGSGLAAATARQITRGACAEEILEGRHFEMLDAARVEALAARMGSLLAPRVRQKSLAASG